MWGEHDGMGWWMLFGSDWFFVFWGFVIWLFALVLGRSDSTESREDTALEILKRRYARGEITKEEYESMRRDILTNLA
jgi:putative membrane protein